MGLEGIFPVFFWAGFFFCSALLSHSFSFVFAFLCFSAFSSFFLCTGADKLQFAGQEGGIPLRSGVHRPSLSEVRSAIGQQKGLGADLFPSKKLK